MSLCEPVWMSVAAEEEAPKAGDKRKAQQAIAKQPAKAAKGGTYPHTHPCLPFPLPLALPPLPLCLPVCVCVCVQKTSRARSCLWATSSSV